MTTGQPLDQEKDKEMAELMSEFERANPGIAEAAKLFGLAIDEYEQILATAEAPDIQTAANTSA